VHKSSALLRRWAAQFPGSKYPATAADITAEQRLHLARHDEELGLILSGDAPVELELQVLEGTLADEVLPLAVREDQARQARIAELEAANVYGKPGYYTADGEYVEPTPGNLSAALELEALAPDRAAALKLAAAPPKANPTMADDIARANAIATDRVESLNHSLSGYF